MAYRKWEETLQEWKKPTGKLLFQPLLIYISQADIVR